MGRIEAIRASKGTFVLTVLSTEEVSQVFDRLEGVYLLIGQLLYGCGMRISEAKWLLLKDIDFANKQIFAKYLRRAVNAAGLVKHITSHTFRHCFATHLLWQGTNIREIQRLLGHQDVKTAEIDTHVRNPSESGVVSPLDRLRGAGMRGVFW